tara:strand:+ start:1388 stop:2200 length:813 start_codon:yes stop_codon:yes gene_type:complete
MLELINNFVQLRQRIREPKNNLMVIRFGNVEVQDLLYRDEIYHELKSNAGFYCKNKEKEQEIYLLWKKKYLEAIYNSDLMLDIVTCSSFHIVGDLFNKLNTWLPSLVYMEEPEWWWRNVINEFEGTIGVVSYFKKDIENQLKVIDKVYPNLNIKKKFVVIKSYNTITGNEPHNDWQETYNDLIKRIDKHKNIGMWLVSCGCYGLPVCNHISQVNKKKSIYVGGLLQLLFGLKGKRWDNRPECNRWYNEHWIYPTEKPKNAEDVEGWCYGK